MSRLLATGRDADVFALGQHRVLRHYRDGGDTQPEAATMAYVAGHGYPVPEVYGADGPDLVMELLDGPTLADALGSGDVEIAAAAQLLADLHDRLHALPPRPGAGEGRVIHLDLHPQNVMVTSRGPVVIDWRNSRNGSPELDVAMSALILAQVAVEPGHERAAAVRLLLDGFVRHVTTDPVGALPEAVARRRADDNQSATELKQLDEAAALVRDLA